MARPKVETDTFNKKRSEVVTVRLDPRLKYLAEIAARKQRRTLSGYIEWAVEQSLSNVSLREEEGDYNNPGVSVSVADAQQKYNLWDVEEAERVVRLAIEFPDLLTFDEQLIWKLIKDSGLLWKWYRDRDGELFFKISVDSIYWDRLREHWDTFRKVALGELPKDHLPKWEKPGSTNRPSLLRPPVQDMDEEIPF